VSRYFCHDHPDVLTLETRIVDARPGCSRSPSTGRSHALRILKIDNKGRHNRRVKYGLLDSRA
jgi:hypothetical protein